jgi:hypothetical protein
MAIYDLYGTSSDDLDKARTCIEAALDIKFELCDSDYHCGEYYRWGKVGEENFVLKKNLDPFDNEPAEISFPKYRILLYVNDTYRSADLQNKICREAKGLIFLRHEDFA